MTSWPASSGEELFVLSRKSFEDLRSFAIAANDPDWDGLLTFPHALAGELTASRRKIFIHTLLHSVRHWPSWQRISPAGLQAGLDA